MQQIVYPEHRFTLNDCNKIVIFQSLAWSQNVFIISYNPPSGWYFCVESGWVLSGYSGFLQQSKHALVRFTGDFNWL